MKTGTLVSPGMKPSRQTIRSIDARRRRVLSVLGCVLSIVVTTGGCRSRAKQDLYVEQLTSEIRLLEDQLYDADYRNRVLADKVRRDHARPARGAMRKSTPGRSQHLHSPPSQPPTLHNPNRPPVPVPDSEPDRSGSVDDAIGESRRPGSLEPPPDADPSPLLDPEPGPDASASPAETGDSTGLSEGLDDFDPDAQIDLGDPMPPALDMPEVIPTPEAPFDPEIGTEPVPPGNQSNVLPAPAMQDPPPDQGDGQSIPPAEPIPPGVEELEIPPIEPGEILPPSPDSEPEQPPGKIEIPGSLDDLNGQGDLPIPDRLSVHPGFSGPQKFEADDEPDGLLLVVNVLDSDGRMMDLRSFDVDAVLSVVALDPSKPGHQAKIARWDFTADEVRKLVRNVPISGFHVPVLWSDTAPEVDQVLIHVRLAAGDDQMTCQSNINIRREASMARWTPRGGRRTAVRPAD